jgi:putative FmdB family regulatory protein
MPIYEFDCRECGNRFEELVAGKVLGTVCPRCGSRRTLRRMSPVSPPSRQPHGAGVREGESKRREREARRTERLAEAKRRRAAGET